MLGRRKVQLGLSTMIVSSRMKILVVALAAGTLLTACGRRGPLEPPPGTASAPAESTNPDGTARDGLRNKRTPILPPKRDLFIDRLLD
ncbi:MAG: lipoprotein [Methylobacterium sp.]|jgi:predicted small lipoprotein YifL|nr:lipoprotein [Methylobacterium sp.]MCA3604194.1 lipoprotein [Methylobacterium sp.]MCA3614333.1 lipoprotein [Methylobacterium sp.]MCA3623298.1 lipoprotein [Methylobacterium sp.]MCA3627779.1 lipoprotein [Methylobacterium sp.]